MELFSLPVSLLRQAAFCPRIPYLMEAHMIPPSPLWVSQGVEIHTKIEKLMRRRTLDRFGLIDPLVHDQYQLASETLRLHGVADIILEDEKQILPVEIKTRMDVLRRGTVAQLIAYGLLAKEHFNKSFLNAVVIDCERNKILPVPNDSKNQAIFRSCYKTLFSAVQSDVLPDSSASQFQCGQCEYLKFCNDRF